MSEDKTSSQKFSRAVTTPMLTISVPIDNSSVTLDRANLTEDKHSAKSSWRELLVVATVVRQVIFKCIESVAESISVPTKLDQISPISL